MINRIFCFGLYCMLIFYHGSSHAGKVVSLASLDWEPYIGEKLPQQGYVASLVREAYRIAGYTAEISFMPWARVVAMARDGTYDGYLPEYYSDSLQEDFHVSEPFPGGPLGFFKRKADSISFRELSDLKPYRIGVVRDYVNTLEFDLAGFLQKDAANNDLINLRKLVARRIDLAVADKLVGTFLLDRDMPDSSGEVEFMSPPLEEKSLFLCISRKIPDGEAKLKAFNDGLQSLKDSGKLEILMKAHGF